MMNSSKTFITPHAHIHRFALGPMQNFVYAIQPTLRGRLALVDPAWEPQKLLDLADLWQQPITDIILTHHHDDHRNAVGAILAKFPARVHVNKHDKPWLKGSGFEVDLVLHDAGDAVELGGGASVKLIHTPGHTPGSQCLEIAGNLLTGDTMFIDGCGRCDLPGGDPQTMYQSLLTILQDLDGHTHVLPGHDYAPMPTATLAQQRNTNPYLQFSTMADFVAYRMRPRK